MGGRKSIFAQDINHTSYTKAEAEERMEIERTLNGKCDNFEPPTFLEGNEIALAEFERLAEELHEIGVLSNVDNISLGMYCQLYSTYVDCVRLERENGSFQNYTNKGGETNLVEAPWSKLKRQTETQMINLSKQLGLTPVDRLKFINIKKADKEEKDPLLTLLKED